MPYLAACLRIELTPTGNLKKLVMNCILRSKCYVAVFSVILDFTILTSKWQVNDTFVLKF